MSVLDYYCSAAESKVVATVADSVTQTHATGETGVGVAPGSNSNVPAQTSNGHQTGSKAGSTTGSTAGSDPASDDGDHEEKKSVGVAPIAGGIVGAIAVIALFGGTLLYMRRKRQQQKRGEQIGGGDGNDNSAPNYTNGKPELMGSSPGTPAPNNGKMGPYAPPPVPELYGPDYKPRPELDGGNAMVTELPPNHTHTSELHGQSPVSPMGYGSPYGQQQQGGYMHPQQMPQELSSPGSGFQPSPQLHGQPVYEFPAHPAPAHRPPNQQEMGWQSGPVESYELESNIGRRQA